MPEDFNNPLKDALNIAMGMESYLAEREMRLLFLLGDCPIANGTALETGSFKGKSTVIRTRASELIDDKKIVAVDPLTSLSITDPSLKGKESGLEDFQSNIKLADVEDRTEFHQMLSYEHAKNWLGKLRLLWIEAGHTYHGTKTDIVS